MKIINLIFTISFLLFAENSMAQVYGCTDPLATNFNSSATQNNGSCVYISSAITPVSSANLPSNLNETSGLIKWNDQIWTHNDNDDLNIYSLDTINGNIFQTYPLRAVANVDWEEISHDKKYIYVGDFGNNLNGNRTDLKILRIEKNSLLAHAPQIDTINFSYSDQNDFTPTVSNKTDFDCEAFVVADDSIFLFTKQWASNKTSLYSLSKTPGKFIANYKSTFDVQGLITGAVALEDKKLTVLCGYTSSLQPFIYLLYDYRNSKFFDGNKRKINISLPYHQVEGIASTNGLKYYISNEYFNYPPFINNLQKLHVLDLAPFLNNYLNTIKSGVSEKESGREFMVFPNPASNQITIQINTKQIGITFTITNQMGKPVLTGKLKTENTTVDLTNLAGGIYILSIGENIKQTFKVIKN